MSRLHKGKAVILLGPRQVGKTTLLRQIAGTLNDVLWMNADTLEIQNLWDTTSKSRLAAMIGKHETIIIDEAQNIPKIGAKLKIFIDEFKAVQVIATGSSAFELADVLSEPLTDRKHVLRLFPVSFEEMARHQGLIEEISAMESRLIYGSYPDILMHPGEKVELLKELVNSYLYRDVLIYGNVKKPHKLVQLLQALAFQVGSEVSYTSLGNMLKMDNETIERYMDLLEKSFVIYRLGALCHNLRNEIKKGKKVYFYDNGIRNALINQFNPLNLRNDLGALWENYLMSERMKYLEYHGIYANRYFWRTHTKQEVDYIEEINGKMHAYEFKWSSTKKVSLPKNFLAAYPGSSFNVITPKNIEDFLMPGML